MKIGEYIRSLFPAGAVPPELTVSEGEQLLAEAKREEQAAKENLADQVELLDAALAAAAMRPADAQAEKAVTAADVAHREAQLRLGKAVALVRGVSEKLQAARAKKAAEDAAVYAAAVRADARELVDTCIAIDSAVDLIVIHLRAALAVQGQLAGVHRDVQDALFSADTVVRTIVGRVESRLHGRTVLRHVATLGRNVAATATGALPPVPRVEPIADQEAAA